MDSRALDKLEIKLDKLDERLDSMNEVQIKMQANLAEHMRRTEIAESSIKILQENTNKRLSVLEAIKGNFSYLGWVLFAGINGAEHILKLLHFIKG